jgi:hypothetical protein
MAMRPSPTPVVSSLAVTLPWRYRNEYLALFYTFFSLLWILFRQNTHPFSEPLLYQYTRQLVLARRYRIVRFQPPCIPNQQAWCQQQQQQQQQ